MFGNKPAPKAGRRAAPVDPLGPPLHSQGSQEKNDELPPGDSIPDLLFNEKVGTSPIKTSTDVRNDTYDSPDDKQPAKKSTFPSFLSDDSSPLANVAGVREPDPLAVPGDGPRIDGLRQETAVFQLNDPEEPHSKTAAESDEGVASLQEELKQLTSENDMHIKSLEQLRQQDTEERGKKPYDITEHPDLRQLEDEAAKLRREIEEQRQRKRKAEEALARSAEAEMSILRDEVVAHKTASVSHKLNELRAEIQETKEEVAVLEEASASMHRELSNDAMQEKSATILTSLFGDMLKTLRTQVDEKMQQISRDEVGSSMKLMIANRVEEAAEAALRRGLALKSFKESRFEAFAKFRGGRALAREEIGDKQFAQLKARRESHLKKIREKTKKSIEERETLLDADIAQVRLAGVQSLDRLTARHKASMQEEDAAYREREKDLLARLDGTKVHQMRLHEQERLSMLRRSQQDVLDTSSQAESTKREYFVNLDERISRLNALRSRIGQEHTAILHSQLSDTNENSGPRRSKSSFSCSETQIAEKQAAVSKLQKHVLVQRESTERSWEKLNKLSSRLEQLLQSLISAQTDGRSTIASTQQKVDLIRTQWEKEHRQQLATSNLSDPTKESSVASQDEVLCRILGKISWQLTELLGKEQKLSSVRQQQLGRLELISESALTRQEDLSRLNSELVGKYDEVARLVAQVETKEAHLRAEERDLNMARDALVDDVKVFEDEGNALKLMSSELYTIAERAAIEHQENSDKLTYTQHWHAHHFSSSQPRRSGVIGRKRFSSDYEATCLKDQPKSQTFRSAVALFDDFQQSSSEDSTLRLLTGSQPKYVAKSQVQPSALGEEFSAGDSQAATLTTPSPDTDQ